VAGRGGQDDYTRAPGWRGKSVVIFYDMTHERFSELFTGRETRDRTLLREVRLRRLLL